jgi:PKD repeat protein
MKTIKTTLAIATLVLASAVAQAQTSTVSLFLTENSNNPTQTHIPLIIGFDSDGANQLAVPDSSDVNTPGYYNTEMFPFTLSSDSFSITTYDSRPNLTSHVTIPFGVLSKDTGDVKIYAVLSSTFAAPTPGYAWIENTLTGEHFNLLDTIKLDIVDNRRYNAQFLLHIGLPVSNITTAETCDGMDDGSLHVQGMNYPGFTHELTFNGSPVHNSVVAGIDTLVQGLAPGNYVSVVRIFGVPVDSSDITIVAAPTLIADFSADYNTIVENDTVNLFDNSTNALTYLWDFGDGDSVTTAGDVMHQYTIAGNYMVTLTVVDANGCTASNFDFIQVDTCSTASSTGGHGHGSMGDVGAGNPNLGSALEAFRNTTRFTVNNTRLMVDLSEEISSTVTIISANGTVIANEKQNDSVATYELPSTGIYIVTVVYSNGTSNSTTVLAQ